MPSNNSKYTEEIRENTAKFILETGKSATSVAEDMGIDTNTVCRWVRDYRKKNKLPSYAESKGIVRRDIAVSEREMAGKIRELEKQMKKKDRLLEDEREKVEILKKSLHIFMQVHE